MLVDPLLLHVFVRLSLLFSLFCSVSDEKSCFIGKKLILTKNGPLVEIPNNNLFQYYFVCRWNLNTQSSENGFVHIGLFVYLSHLFSS